MIGCIYCGYAIIRNKWKSDFLMIILIDFILNNTPDLMIIQEYFVLLQLEIQNFDIVCSPVWTSRDRCCDLPSMVSMNEPEGIQKNVIDTKFNNIAVRLLLDLVLTTHLNHSCQSSQSAAPYFRVLCLRQ